MGELMVDFITSLDGYAAAEGWPGWWGLEGPEYLAWLDERPDATLLMGANTYRLMAGFAADAIPAETDEPSTDEEASINGLTAASKVVFSSTLEEPLSWTNTTAGSRDPRNTSVSRPRLVDSTRRSAGDPPDTGAT